MESCKSRFSAAVAAILMAVCSCFNVYAQSADLFSGEWYSRNGLNPEDDSYITISKTGGDEFFVVYVNPYWEHKYDYSGQGRLTEEGYIHVELGERNFYLEISDGCLLHYIDSLWDPFFSLFRRIGAEESCGSRDLKDISLEEFMLLLKALETGGYVSE